MVEAHDLPLHPVSLFFVESMIKAKANKKKCSCIVIINVDYFQFSSFGIAGCVTVARFVLCFVLFLLIEKKINLLFISIEKEAPSDKEVEQFDEKQRVLAVNVAELELKDRKLKLKEERDRYDSIVFLLLYWKLYYI